MKKKIINFKRIFLKVKLRAWKPYSLAVILVLSVCYFVIYDKAEKTLLSRRDSSRIEGTTHSGKRNRNNTLQLHKLDASPPSRAVMMLCAINEVDVSIIDIVRDDPMPIGPSFLELGILRSVPVLVDGDLILEDSNAILQYLADAYGNLESLYPKDKKQRALVNQKLFFDSGILYPRIEDSVVSSRFKLVVEHAGVGNKIQFPAILEGIITVSSKRLKDIEEAYGYLDDFLSKSKYLAGDTMTIADIAAIASVTSLVNIFPMDPNQFPKSAAWMNEMTKKHFCKTKNERGADLYGTMIQYNDEYYNKSELAKLIKTELLKKEIPQN